MKIRSSFSITASANGPPFSLSPLRGAGYKYIHSAENGARMESLKALIYMLNSEGFHLRLRIQKLM